MERSSLCSKLKHESISNNTNRGMKQMYDYKFKASSWDFGNEHNNIGNWKESDLVAAGFSWPPRSYTCSFCKREFRSAQALGGHMNVHRRDRARLRLSPSTRDNNNNNDHNIILGGGNKNAAGGQLSTVNLNLDPNPILTPNPNLSSLFTKFPQFTSTLPPICPLPANAVSETRRFGEEDVSVRNSGPVASDLIKMKGPKVLLGVEKFDSGVEKGRGVLKKGDPFVRLDLEIGLFSQSKEELDLELRLGYA